MKTETTDINKLKQDLADKQKEAQEIQQKIEQAMEDNKPTGRIKDYSSVLTILGQDATKDVVSIDGFDEAENRFLKAIIQKVRICKAYRQDWFPKAREQRWYVWYRIYPSGFVFADTSYDNDSANTSSASRLCFRTEEDALDFVKKFKDIDEQIIDLD